MSLKPQMIHAFEQMEPFLAEIGRRLDKWKADRIAGGYTEQQAWESTRDLEQRILGRIFTGENFTDDDLAAVECARDFMRHFHPTVAEHLESLRARLALRLQR